MAGDDFLSRWSRRKLEARREPQSTPAAAPQAPAAKPVAAAAPAMPPAAAKAPEPAPLPPVESLTGDSDFSAFMQPHVDATLRRQALKKLLHDPRFNVMDGLDVYIDDYSKPDPLPEGWLEKLNQMARLGDYQEPPTEEEAAVASEQAAVPTPLETPVPPSTPVADAGADVGEKTLEVTGKSPPQDA